MANATTGVATKSTGNKSVQSDTTESLSTTVVVEPAVEQGEAPPKTRKRKREPRIRRPGPATAEQLGEMEIGDVWLLYREYGCEVIRNFLIERHYHIVKYTAERMHMRLPNEVEVEDLMSAGLFGLMDAIDAFDIDRGVKFETYCGTRIKGAIFDELRAMDWVPRLVRSRTSKVDLARRDLEMRSGRKATDDEISGHMNLDKAEYKKVSRDARPVGMVSLNRKWFETDSSKDVREIDVIMDKKQENPLQSVQKQDLQALITKGLIRAERLIIILYYYEEMTMKEIGITLDLSESRVSQMHSSILARLKAQMQHREKEF
ncbi:MAG: FliA/WhiG family RNA polymerase sigma factor [Phycisphaerales bacterium]|nr:FliA/WhiG family RNA polymerase sigma factor [Phycisphaerales bacterium]